MRYAIFIILILLLVIDLPVITKINNKMYKKQFDRINKSNNSNSSKYIAGIICYILLALAIYVFIVLPENDKSKSSIEIIKKGMLLGLIIYGVYNSTNKATINEFGTFEAIVDTIWGSFLIGFISLISVLIVRKY